MGHKAAAFVCKRGSECIEVIALFGGLGSIGRRYAAILDFYQVPFTVFDKDLTVPKWSLFEKVIIATPTNTHLEVLSTIPKSKTVLCEKPVDKDPNKIPNRKNLYVVNNYLYLMRSEGFLIDGNRIESITYDFYNTGKDGVLWDCCQLIYLDPDADIKTRSPFWRLEVNGQEVSYYNLERSYAQMLLDFVEDKTDNLWNWEDAREMSRAVIEREELFFNADTNWRSS